MLREKGQGGHEGGCNAGPASGIRECSDGTGGLPVNLRGRGPGSPPFGFR